VLNLLTEDAWHRMRVLASDSASPCLAAVPFIGAGAISRLPLKQGDVLVCRFDKNAVRAGLVDPREILKYLKRGVDVHAVANLHAKVFVIGTSAFVGSTNVSASSEHQLVEAVCESTERRFVSACHRFIESLRGDHIDPFFARQLVKLYKPPRVETQGKRMPRSPVLSELAVVGLKTIDWDDPDQEAIDQSREKASSQVPNAYRLDLFRWAGALPKALRPGMQVIRATRYSPRRVFIDPPARVLAIKRYRGARGERAIVYVAARKHFPERNLASIIKRVPEADFIRRMGSFRLVRNPMLARRLMALWPSIADG
jgi:hypothetical protein